MGCCGRGEQASAGATYPREIVLADGSRKTVTSAAMERTERERARQAERAQAKARGYTTDR